MQYKTVEGFKFLHVANAFLSQVPWKVTYEGGKEDRMGRCIGFIVP